MHCSEVMLRCENSSNYRIKSLIISVRENQNPGGRAFGVLN